MDFFRDATWQFVGVIIAIFAFIASIVIYLKQRNVKGLVYEVISDTSVLSIEEEVKTKIQVLYNGKPVDDVRLIVLKVWNYRDASISPADYILPITFDFGNKAEILDTEVIETTPNDLIYEVHLNFNKNKVIMKPVLLNGKDVIKLKVLLTRSQKQLQVNTRINGVHKIITSEELPKFKRNEIIKKIGKICNTVGLISLLIALVLGFTLALFVRLYLNVITATDTILSHYPLPIHIGFYVIAYTYSIAYAFGLFILFISLLVHLTLWILKKSQI